MYDGDDGESSAFDILYVVEYYDPTDVTEVRCTGCTPTSVPVVNEFLYAYRVLMQAVDPASVICDLSFCQLTSDVLVWPYSTQV